MNALVSVDARRGELIVASYSRTSAGFWVMNGHFDRLDAGASEADLGSAIGRRLADSESGVDLPPRSGPSPFKPVLDALGVSSYAQYTKGASSVGVAVVDGRLAVTPKRNGGSRRGFVEIDELTEQLDGASPMELGEAVLRALEQSW